MKARMLQLAVAVILLFASLGTVLAQNNQIDLTIGVQGLPPTLEPLRENSNVFMRFVYNVFDPLIEFDADTFSLQPALAESWERVDDRTLDVRLRQGVLFHNGDTLDAEDVVFTFGSERMFNEDLPGYGNAQQFFRSFESVVALDEYTVRFTSIAPDPLMEMRLTVNVGAIISKQAFEAAPDYDTFSRTGVGTGPYRVVEFVTDDFVRLEPFAEYWGGGEHDFSSITFQIVPELSARVAGLIAGDYQIITEVTPDLFETINSNTGTSVVGGPIRNIRVIIYDSVNNDVLDDPRIRQALNFAIDRELIVETLYSGATQVPQGMQFPYYGDMFLGEWQGQEYNPDRARELLAEAGYNGEPIVYRTQGGYYTYQGETAEILVAMWQAVGLNVELEVVENWDAVLATDNGRYIWDLSTTMFYPDPVGHLWRLYGTSGLVQNSGSWINEDFNALGVTLESSTDPAERRSAFEGMLDIWQNQDPPGTYLHYLTMFYGISSSIQWTPTFMEYLDLRPDNVEVIGG